RRRRHTRFSRDWSSDVCSSDLIAPLTPRENEPVLPKTSSGLFNSTNADYVLRNLNTRFLVIAGIVTDQCVDMAVRDAADRGYLRSEERRVGNECGARWSTVVYT